MDYGLTQALSQMYSGPSQMEKKNMEYSRLQQMQSYFDKERQKKEEASLKMQMYDESVSKFADQLLAPDRNRIYQKSRVLRQSVRQVIEANGGDMRAFYANGGHDVLASYKNSLIQSEESSNYLQNKQNVGFILKAMNEGKAHLISPIDKANFDNYMKNGEGKITYSGMMNDIKMPDASKYEYGQEIPLGDILKENYTNILANYAVYHAGTSRDPNESGRLPSDTDLLAFTAAMYGTTKGTSQERRAMNQEKLSWNNELRAQQNQPYDVAGKMLSNEQAALNIDSTKLQMETQKLQNEKTELEMITASTGMGTGSGTGGSGGGGGTGGNGLTDIYGMGTGESTDQYNVFTDLGSSVQDYDANAGNAYTAANNLIRNNDFFGTVVNGKWSDKGAKQFNYGGPGDMFKSSPKFMDGMGLINSGTFTPTAAFNIFKTNKEKDLYATYAAGQIGAKYENGMFKNFTLKKGLKGLYSADGKNLEAGHASLADSAEFGEDYTGDYRLVGTIMAAKLKDPKNGEQIIMNRGNKLAKDGYKADAKAKMSTFAVIEKDGTRLYVEVDPANMINNRELQKSFDVTSATNQFNFNRGKNKANVDALKASQQEYLGVRTQIRRNPSFQSVASLISGDGTYGDVALLDSYYMTIKSNTNASYDQIVNSQSTGFIKLVNEANNALPNETGGNLLGRLKNGNISSQKFFELMSKTATSPQDKSMVQQWFNMYNRIKYNK